MCEAEGSKRIQSGAVCAEIRAGRNRSQERERRVSIVHRLVSAINWFSKKMQKTKKFELIIRNLNRILEEANDGMNLWDEEDEHNRKPS